MGTWESSMTLEVLEFDCRGQNISHWGVLYIIEKLLKCRCRKWSPMGHLDICSTSYDKKKGRESNWHVDLRPLKVGNWPNPGVCSWSATHRWKALQENYKFALDFIPIGGLSKELWSCKVSRVQTGIVSGLLLGSPGTKKPFICRWCGEAHSILYGGRWWPPPNPGRDESCESRVTMVCPNTKDTPEIELTNLLVGLM
jgi:hypothetical protein